MCPENEGHPSPTPFSLREITMYKRIQILLSLILLMQTLPAVEVDESVNAITEPPDTTVVQVDTVFGSLRVITEPEGAQVKFDNEIIEYVTPLTLYNIPLGKHRLALKKQDHFLVTTVITIGDDQERELRFKLQSISPLIIASNPSGAKLSIQGESIGATPYVYKESIDEPIAIMLERDGFEPLTQSISPKQREQDTIAFTLKSVPAPVAPEPVQNIPEPEPQQEIKKRNPVAVVLNIVAITLFAALGIGVAALEQ